MSKKDGRLNRRKTKRCLIRYVSTTIAARQVWRKYMTRSSTVRFGACADTEEARVVTKKKKERRKERKEKEERGESSAHTA